MPTAVGPEEIRRYHFGVTAEAVLVHHMQSHDSGRMPGSTRKWARDILRAGFNGRRKRRWDNVLE